MPTIPIAMRRVINIVVSIAILPKSIEGNPRAIDEDDLYFNPYWGPIASRRGQGKWERPRIRQGIGSKAEV
jgi:hypothetical protein